MGEGRTEERGKENRTGAGCNKNFKETSKTTTLTEPREAFILLSMFRVEPTSVLTPVRPRREPVPFPNEKQTQTLDGRVDKTQRVSM